MTPKEKAEELVNKFKPHSHFWVHDLGRQKDYDLEQLENAKECALISIEEKYEGIVNVIMELKARGSIDNEIYLKALKDTHVERDEVKQEIERI